MDPRLARPIRTLLALAALCLAGLAPVAAQNVLFVGNSFTFYPGQQGIGEVHDLNGKHYGGVPELFQVIAESAGKSPVVHMETEGGKNLRFHYEDRRHLLDRAWDVVVLQDLSTGPLIENGNRASHDSFRAHVEKFKTLFAARQPDVKIWLYETWGRPDLVKKGRVTSIDVMQDRLRAAISAAARDFDLAGYAPVGGAFLAATRQGVADNPATELIEGELRLWGKDDYHQTAVGSYLAALVFYACIYDADPRELANDNPAADAIQLSPADSKRLQVIAWESLRQRQ